MPPAPFDAKPFEPDRAAAGAFAKPHGPLRGKGAKAGRIIGATSDPASGKLHMPASITSQLASGKGASQGVDKENARYQKVAARAKRTILFLVDTSGSVVPSERLAMVKGCVISLLKDAYAKRTRVGVVSFGGAKARLVLPFSSSVEMAASCIDKMPAGGPTPLLGALEIAALLIELQHNGPVEVVVLSDGRYDRERTVAAEQAIRAFGAFCAKHGCPIRFVDVGAGTRTAASRAIRLARMLQADFRRLEDMRAESLAASLADRGLADASQQV